MKDTKWCCLGMQTAFSERGDRTIFVFAEPPNEFIDRVTFWIAMRAVTQDALSELHPLALPPETFLTIATRKAISFCPWCGTRLARFYRRRYSQLVDAKLTEEFKLPAVASLGRVRPNKALQLSSHSFFPSVRGRFGIELWRFDRTTVALWLAERPIRWADAWNTDDPKTR